MSDEAFVEAYRVRVGGGITAARDEMSAIDGAAEVDDKRGICVYNPRGVQS